MSDEIFINDLHLRAIIGIKPEERVNRQDVLVNLCLLADTRTAAESDEIDHAVDYRTIAKEVIELVEQSEHFLVETLAAEIAETCLRNPRLERVRVSVEKPGAIRFARSAGVRIERSRDDFAT